jgi:hypothetical protein
MTTNGHALAQKNGFPEAESHDHVCPGCGSPVVCEYKVIATARAQARGDLIAAAHLERKLLGLPSGRPPTKIHYTPEELQAMVDKLGNINRARKALGVGHATFKRHLLGDKSIR